MKQHFGKITVANGVTLDTEFSITYISTGRLSLFYKLYRYRVKHKKS